MKCFFTYLALTLLLATAHGQDKANPILDNTRLFASNEFAAERMGAIKWVSGADAYTMIEKSESIEKAYDIARYDVKTGQRSLLVKAEELIPQAGQKPLEIGGYELSPNGKLMLIFTNTKRVWRYNTIGDYWVLDMQSKQLKKVGSWAPQSSLMFAKFSPNSQQVAYVCRSNGAHDIYSEDIATAKVTRLTNDGSITTINGTFDWAYEEEFGCRDGFRWSPDSKQIAYWQIDASGIGVFNMINYTDSIYSKIIPVQYPKVGLPVSGARIGVVPANGGATTWLPIDDDQRAHYLPYMDWTLNANELMVQQMNRNQTWCKLLRYNTQTGTIESLLTSTANGAWVDVVKDIYHLKDNSFIWTSEKDGWRHLYQISHDGKRETLITKGSYDIVSVNHIDEKNGWIYFTAALDKPIYRQLYKIKMDGKSTPVRITPTEGGWHSYQISPTASYAIHSYSRIHTPTKIDIISLAKHETIRTAVGNEKLAKAVAQLDIVEPEFHRLQVSPTLELDCWMVKPANFDASKKYPVIFYVYGEPINTTVNDSWGGVRFLYHHMLAQKGYIVMSIENRGTPSPRGCEYRKASYKKVGIIGPQDQAAGVEAALKRWSFIDGERVGIWGWSGGGTSTLNAMFKYPKLYRTGIAVAAVSNLLLYDAIYQERYMAYPTDNIEGYRDGSPINSASGLEGKLMIIHGTADDNVHYQCAELLYNELIKHNKPFDMFSYPNRSHSINEGENTSRHLYNVMTSYWLQNLTPGPR